MNMRDARRSIRTWFAAGLIGAGIGVSQGCGAVGLLEDAPNPVAATARRAAIARAQVWRPTDVGSVDITAGPQGQGAFPFLATVECRYVEADLGGQSPKFACASADDELKVKYGGNNAEVYGEAIASRLLWALGFGADRMYPVRVVCRECPREFGGIARDEHTVIFDPAIIERRMAAREFSGDDGWAWSELEAVDEDAGGALRAHVDALKLLAVFMQHTDSKPDNQRLVCLGPAGGRSC
jgi:hypothetical protein